VTGDLIILLIIILAIAGNLYLSVRALGYTRQLIAQVAVLTLRVIDASEALQALEVELRAALDAEP
jgi:hypothetical protein